jgi:transcriptional regulator with XRE-family HTH domain
MGQGDPYRPGEIAARLRYFLGRAGLKAARLAEACEVTPGAVSEWLAGHVEPTHENLARAVRACGVDLGEFWSTPLVVMPDKAAG